MMLVNPKLKIDGLKKVLYTLPIPPLLLMILALVFIKDSPKNLFLKGNPKEAIQLLEKMSNKKFDDDYKNKLKELKKMDEKSTLWDLMQRKYRRVISILSVMFIINAYMTYAILLISSITFKVQFKDIKSEEIESKQAIVFWMMIPGTIVAGLICEISWLGRKNTCIIGYGGFALFGIFACIFPQYLEVFLGLMGFFSQFNYNVSYVYVCEAFPTKIRTIALGFCVFWNKLSGFITHFFLVFLHNQYNLAPYIFGLIASTMLVLLTWFLPYDTLNRPIETEHHDHDHSENSKDLTNKVDEQTSLIKKEA